MRPAALSQPAICIAEGMGEGSTVSVSYVVQRADLKAAALMASRFLPGARRWRLTCWGGAVLATALGVVLLVAGGPERRLTGVVLILGAAGYAGLGTRRFFAWQAARNPLSKLTLGERTFAADPTGISISGPEGSGSFHWPGIDLVVDGADAVVFIIRPSLFAYVPAGVLSESDRAALHTLAGPDRTR
jgi:hypothetical protein